MVINLWVLSLSCQAAAGDDDDDDDLDLFGDETEEEKKAAEERETAKASTKKKESKFSFCMLFLTVECRFLCKFNDNIVYKKGLVMV